ncbi:hybrid sensor histidine kinase/response regulator [Radicibacter daui]|uniref:hybrid sensor histidine kinase/response regulator n=1 Tax=Radicibacter daui TaxID=3064829 RepID=UPI004046F4C3
MNPDDMRDASMLELFRMEAEAQCAVLNSGLIELERMASDAGALEACMRAAHSLKGAARIIDLEPAVHVAHAMEDLLVAAQEGRLALSTPHIDVLLQGADMLLRLGSDAGADSLAAAGALTERLKALLAGEAVIAQVSASGPAPTVAAAPAADRAPAEPAGAKLLRVSTENLDHLLDISAKSLVEFQRVKALRTALDRIKQGQKDVARVFAALRETTSLNDLAPQARALIEELQRLLAAGQQDMQTHIEAFDDFAWAGERRGKQLYDAALGSRMRPFSEITAGWQRMVRDLGQELGKRVRLEIVGGSTQVDRDVLERLDAPLLHLLRNAVDHGIEAPEERRRRGKAEEGRLLLTARHHAGMLVLELADDGAGVDLERLRGLVVERGYARAETAALMEEEELLAFLFLPGFSMRGEVTAISGRGVGLDAVQHDLRQLRGGLHMTHEPGLGSQFHLEVPLTLSVIRSLLVEIGGEAYAFPLTHIDRMIRLQPDGIVQLEGRQHFWHEGKHVGLVLASQLLQRPAGEVDAAGIPVVLVGDRQTTYGLAVDRFLGERNLVVLPLDPRLGKIRDVSAGALLEDGRPALILDVEDLLGTVGRLLGSGTLERVGGQGRSDNAVARKRVLVVDDSLTVRELERKLLAGRGYDVAVAVDGIDGWNALKAEQFDLLITDIDMPRMDGIELVTRVRGNSRLQSLPVMVVSYKDREQDRQRGLEAGADYYLAKASFHDETLLDAVHGLIGPALG